MTNLKLPQLSRIEFFRAEEDELASALAKAIANHQEHFPDSPLSPLHAVVAAWSAAAYNVLNGGFTQFFYNHRGNRGVVELAALLDELELPKIATALRSAETIYLQHQAEFNVDNPWDGLFGSIPEFEKLDRAFAISKNRGSKAIQAWIRTHISELATDETGQPIDVNFTGTIESRDESGNLKESLEVKKGKPHGVYREYFDDGSLRDSVFYKSGKVSGDFWPNGNLKYKESKRGTNLIKEWFYPSGALQKRYVAEKSGYTSEPIQVFHENGQLAEEVNTIEADKVGRWVKFFNDGSPELEAEYKSDKVLVVHNAWNAGRQPIVTNGQGTFREPDGDLAVSHELFFEKLFVREAELQDGIPHGKVTTWSKGVLWGIEHYVAGIKEGEATSYWNNGRVRKIARFVQGEEESVQEFPKFDRPVPAVVIELEANERLYTIWRHIAVDEYPQPLNLPEVQAELQIPQFLKEVHERNQAGTIKSSYEDCSSFEDGITYFLTVDTTGQVTAAKANGSSIYSGGNWNTYPPLLTQLRFQPGRLRGHAVECRVIARVEHTFVEGR
ncbi:toxin-antitoxin system YwqK family antitoxin [Anatilimnocola floriformis]|uniref:toxin-antitoxin system YwqK family antitoxin n=1 Tax=Anatilimnocola floriformis TaxID=2948575 RepID=UPI0020C4FB9C|nr:DUF4375 domain-containing protein [Anatilimnocola floriformis]